MNQLLNLAFLSLYQKKKKKNEYINGHAVECWELLPALQLRTVHVYEFDLTLTRFQQKSLQTMIQ